MLYLVVFLPFTQLLYMFFVRINTIYIYILRNRSKAQSDKGRNLIWINDDVGEFTRRQRKSVRDVASYATENNVQNIKIHSESIIVHGKKYRHGDLDLLPVKISLSKAKTPVRDNHIYFQGETSELSNFYPTKVKYEANTFESVEQGLQHLKAKHSKKNLIANKILRTKNPYEAKRLGNMVEPNAEWKKKEKQVMKTLLVSKFTLNERLGRLLQNTGEKELHEATRDPKWSIGAELSSKAAKQHRGQGGNLLGNLLKEVREYLNTNILQNQQPDLAQQIDDTTDFPTDDELTPMPGNDDEEEEEDEDEERRQESGARVRSTGTPTVVGHVPLNNRTTTAVARDYQAGNLPPTPPAASQPRARDTESGSANHSPTHSHVTGAKPNTRKAKKKGGKTN